MGKNPTSKFTQKLKATLPLLLALAIAGFAHGINMFNYPYFENDEATYLSQAWSVLTQGRLSPYTYWYDHAPFGWFFIAIWLKLTGGLFTFGYSLNSGRVLMLVVHLLSTALLYFIVNRLAKSRAYALLATLIYSLTPLGIYFQRRLLLDNIMIFWILVAYAFLLVKNKSLIHYGFSAIFFGLAVLSKENAIFFAIPLCLQIILYASKKHKGFALAIFLSVAGSLISTYVLFALLKGELFLPSEADEHVSLLKTLSFQLGRGSRLPFWSRESDFYGNFYEWVSKDPATIIFGIFATIASLLLLTKQKVFRVPLSFSLVFWLFLMRGSLVIDFYIIPLIPLLAINIALLFKYFSDKMGVFGKPFLATTVTILILNLFLSAQKLYFTNETQPQRQAVQFIKDNVATDQNIAIDNYAYLDLVEGADKQYRNSAWFWKIMTDPEVQDRIDSDPLNVEYILLTHEMVKQMNPPTEKNQLIRDALSYSNQVAMFGPTSRGTYINLSKYLSTNGDWAAIYKIKSKPEIILETAWQYYKENYIHSYGQVIDPQTGYTTSEGQSYGLLRSVWQGDKETFDSVYAWTKDHMQYRQNDRLFSWLWSPEDNELLDSNNAADADIDIALSLVLAYEKWGDPKYLDTAKPIISDIWRHEVVAINGQGVLVSSADSRRGEGYLVNPSYFHPAAYRKFAQYDTANNWSRLADDTYKTLGQITNSGELLPPNWVLLDVNGGHASTSEYINGPDNDNYGFDAFRIFPRIYLDHYWNANTDAYDFLSAYSNFFTNEWQRKGSVAAIYKTKGSQVANYSSNSTNIAPLLTLYITDPQLAQDFYKKEYDEKFNIEFGYWGDGSNYYEQNWAWFATLLYSGTFSI